MTDVSRTIDAIRAGATEICELYGLDPSHVKLGSTAARMLSPAEIADFNEKVRVLTRMLLDAKSKISIIRHMAILAYIYLPNNIYRQLNRALIVHTESTTAQTQLLARMQKVLDSQRDNQVQRD